MPAKTNLIMTNDIQVTAREIDLLPDSKETGSTYVIFWVS